MKQVISIGKQDYASLREEDYFFIDKTNFIKKWWEAGDEITLIARPRRFGKTLNMSMLNCFFSNQYADRSDLFQGLSIWKEKKYQKLQGTYPVIFLSFADVKQTNYKDAICKIKRIIATVYQQYIKIVESDQLSSLHDGADITQRSAAATFSCVFQSKGGTHPKLDMVAQGVENDGKNDHDFIFGNNRLHHHTGQHDYSAQLIEGFR